jgi:hypothetical protein
METKGIKMPSLVSHAEANGKRSLAAKEQHEVSNPRAGEILVRVQDEHTPKQTERPGRAARAKQANVSTATQARVENLANKRLDLLEKVAYGKLIEKWMRRCDFEGKG